MGLMNASPVGYQNQVIWGLVSWVAAIKVGVVDVWMSSIQGETGDLVLLLGVSWRENLGEMPTLSSVFW